MKVVINGVALDLSTGETGGEPSVPETRLIPYTGSELVVEEGESTTRANVSTFASTPLIGDVTIAPYRIVIDEEPVHYIGVFLFTSNEGDLWTLTIKTSTQLSYQGGEDYTPGVNYTAGDGIVIENEVISVETPVKDSEADVFETDVPDATKSKSLYFVKDAETGVTKLCFKGTFVNLGIPDYVAGNGMTVDGMTLSVDCPIVPITQEEYDDLSEEQKNSETLWIVVDSEYVIEEYDTDDGWHVRKHPDGYLEMAILKDATITNWEAEGSLHKSDPDVGGLDFPVICVEKYSELSSIAKSNGVAFIGCASSSNSPLSKSATYTILTTTEDSLSITYSILVTGKWK